ncbi:MAG: VWA domain-containing protein [Lentisphaerae bacterium]|jgi:Ca-activated chloride channel family protein|nr:VWA domain-containing protein [Lentisphaerota bacterium]
MIRFETPWALLALLVPLLLWLWRHRSRWRRAALAFSSTTHARQAAAQSWRARLLWLPGALRTLALLLLALALARPQAGREQIRDVSQGIAIAMVLDRSGSMRQEMDFEGRLVNRLDVAKEVFSRFVFGDGKKLRGRPTDLIGMLAFARYADTICPLTLSHGTLRPFLDTIQLVIGGSSEDATAIGDALALAAARLHTAEETLKRQLGKDKDVYKIKSKVIILLTDGENNVGRQVEDGAALAAKWGIKIYAIGIGGGEGYQVVQTPLGRYKMPLASPGMNTRPLEAAAAKTGGLFRMANDAASLLDVYREIDELERSDVESIRFVDYRELFTPLVLAALLLLTLELVLNCTWLRRIP